MRPRFRFNLSRFFYFLTLGVTGLAVALMAGRRPARVHDFFGEFTPDGSALLVHYDVWLDRDFFGLFAWLTRPSDPFSSDPFFGASSPRVADRYPFLQKFNFQLEESQHVVDWIALDPGVPSRRVACIPSKTNSYCRHSLSPSGERFLFAGDDGFWIGHLDGPAQLRHLRVTGKQAVFDPSETRLITEYGVWDITSGTQLVRAAFSTEEQPTTVTLAPDGVHAATMVGAQAAIWDIRDGSVRHLHPGMSGWRAVLGEGPHWLPDGTLLGCDETSGGPLLKMDVETGEHVPYLTSFNATRPPVRLRPNEVCVSGNGRYALINSPPESEANEAVDEDTPTPLFDHVVLVCIDPEIGQHLAVLDLQENTARRVNSYPMRNFEAISPDGRFMLCNPYIQGINCQFHVVDLAFSSLVREIEFEPGLGPNDTMAVVLFCVTLLWGIARVAWSVHQRQITATSLTPDLQMLEPVREPVLNH